VDGRRRTGQVIDPLYFQKDRLGDVMAYQLEAVIIHEMDDIPFVAGKEIVEAEHLMPVPQQPFTQM